MTESRTSYQVSRIDYQGVKSELQEARTAIAALQEELESERRERQAVDLELHSRRRDAAKESAIVESYERSISDVNRDRVKLRNEVRVLQDRIRGLNRAVGAADNAKVSFEQENLDLRQENSNLRQENSDLLQQKSDFSQAVHTLQKPRQKSDTDVKVIKRNVQLPLRPDTSSARRTTPEVMNGPASRSERPVSPQSSAQDSKDDGSQATDREFQAHQSSPAVPTQSFTLTHDSAIFIDHEQQQHLRDIKSNPDDLTQNVSQDILRVKDLSQKRAKCENEWQEIINGIPRLAEMITGLEQEQRSLKSKTRLPTPEPKFKERRDASERARLNALERTKYLGDDVGRLRKMVDILRDSKADLELKLNDLVQLQKDMGRLRPMTTGQIAQTPLEKGSTVTRAIQQRFDKIHSHVVEMERLFFELNKEGPFLWQKTSAVVLDLMGSIRTFCRVRQQALAASSRSIEILSPARLKVRAQPTTTFKFDGVFGPSFRNQEVVAALRPHIRSLLDQRNVHLFCYGTSSVTQTQTLFGSTEVEEERGILLFLIEDCLHLVHNIFNRHEHLGKLTMSSFDIHGKNIRDCLIGQDLRSSTQSLLQEEPVSDIDQGRKRLNQALENRQVHTQSSSSHFGIQLNFAFDVTFRLTVVDLASSERGRSGKGRIADSTDPKELPPDLKSLQLVVNDMARTGRARDSGDNTVNIVPYQLCYCLSTLISSQ
ncbi:MAG: hypothetical protein Q9225_006818 [Loekoesia sp. 1 TL-2023]